MTEFSDKLHGHLQELEDDGKLSTTAPGRFDPLIGTVAERLELDGEEIYVVSCARPNNLHIRLSQGKAQHRHHRIGLGVMTGDPPAGEGDARIGRGLTGAANFIAPGNAKYDAVGVIVKADGRWTLGGVVEASGAGLGKKLAADYPGLEVREVNSPTKVEPSEPSEAPDGSSTPTHPEAENLVARLQADLNAAHLLFPDELIHRFCASLLAKRFTVLTGLPGSGKTKLAQAFATWLSEDNPEDDRPFKIVPVGADWTGNEQILGYPDALNPNRYETRPALDLVLRAVKHPQVPHFLILDEMNMSHVERYFSDFLSAMETDAPLDLYSGPPREGAPATLRLPPNLFVIGTVNVDETTYLFSPKVLDRANVVEFRVEEDQVFSLLESLSPVDMTSLVAKGSGFADAFVAMSQAAATLESDESLALGEAFRRIFRIMEVFGREFGYRTLGEAGRFVSKHKQLADAGWSVDDAIDAQIYQRVLPRLNGSRAQLQLNLWALGRVALSEIDDATFEAELLTPLRGGSEIANPFEGLSASSAELSGARFPLTCAKVFRMCERLREGFVSFMEA